MKPKEIQSQLENKTKQSTTPPNKAHKPLQTNKHTHIHKTNKQKTQKTNKPEILFTEELKSERGFIHMITQNLGSYDSKLFTLTAQASYFLERV